MAAALDNAAAAAPAPVFGSAAAPAAAPATAPATIVANTPANRLRQLSNTNLNKAKGHIEALDRRRNMDLDERTGRVKAAKQGISVAHLAQIRAGTGLVLPTDLEGNLDLRSSNPLKTMQTYHKMLTKEHQGLVEAAPTQHHAEPFH